MAGRGLSRPTYAQGNYTATDVNKAAARSPRIVSVVSRVTEWTASHGAGMPTRLRASGADHGAWGKRRYIPLPVGEAAGAVAVHHSPIDSVITEGPRTDANVVREVEKMTCEASDQSCVPALPRSTRVTPYFRSYRSFCVASALINPGIRLGGINISMSAGIITVELSLAHCN